MSANEPLEIPAKQPPDLAEGIIMLVGNATTIIRFAGFTILTDPTFLHQGDHVHLGEGMYARREVEPACQPADLPPLDLCVLSHFHGDHFDQVAIDELDKTLPIVTTRHAVGELKKQGFNQGYALDTWDTQHIVKGDVELGITAMPARHGPEDFAHLLPPVIGSILDFSSGGQHLYRLYITGDTTIYDRLYDIHRFYPGIDLGLFHIGGTTLLGVVVTVTGAQGVQAAEIVQPRTAIPIHFNDYSVFQSGLDDFREAASRAGTSVEFRYIEHGESYRFRAREAEGI
jgi:L-ascorbate metabolism protein UlaG (beta-lactamase superfamily)